MRRLVFLLILTVNVMNIHCTIRVGYIYNTAYTSTIINAVITYRNTCSECICYAFFPSTSPLYVGLNCYINNKTCVLFANYLSASSTVQSNVNSTFIFIQQPPSQNATTALFPLAGVTVAGYTNGTWGSASNALTYPWGLAFGVNNSLLIADSSNHRVMKIQEGNLTASIVGGTGVSGNNVTQLMSPTEIAVDAAGNLYVNDNFNYRVMLWRKNSSTGVRVAGIGFPGNTSNTIGLSTGLAVDSQGNIYVSDYGNHRVMKWGPNATNGAVIAGTTSVSGSSNSLLNYPYGLYLDENNSYIYIADLNNHRIQRYRLGVTTNGTTVAGGNGQGSGSNQLNAPYGVCVSRKTGDVYVADKFNNRIQRWSSGATSGVTIVGVAGVSGTNATLLMKPDYVLLSMNETFLYVSDTDNHRVQRYQLP